MFYPAGALRDNPALFACYVLFVYFRGRNAVSIEREMRGLGFSTFHRRNLYPRGKQPGWIGRFDWTGILTAETQRRGDQEATWSQIDTDTHRSENSDHNDISVHPRSSVAKNSLSSPRLGVSAVEKPDFHTWLKRVAPNMTWDWKHQQVIIKQLEKVTTGECKRLMIFLPPRHGKTELVSVKYTAWRMQKDPSMNVILGSYNQRLADKMSRKIRTAICDSEQMRIAECGMRNGLEAHSSHFPGGERRMKSESQTTNQHENTRSDTNAEIPHSAIRIRRFPSPARAQRTQSQNGKRPLAAASGRSEQDRA